MKKIKYLHQKVYQHVDGYFPTIYVATIGDEYKVKIITENDVVDINLHIWDTAKQNDSVV